VNLIDFFPGRGAVNVRNERIAIVGIGLRYPDATCPQELWENVLAGRRAFRRVPDEQKNAADSYRLALDTSAVALADAGAPDAAGLPRRTTGVILGGGPTGAGRICDHFDLGGRGFAVDGPASSSLLSVVHSAEALLAGDLDAVITGGVDEIGCGMVVLMREADALTRRCRIYASITGWGVSSDGTGGNHRLALTRAYERAGYGVDTVSFFEGTGAATEIAALSHVRRAADPTAPPAALGTIKGNLDTATGVAGLIKAALAIHHQVIPPATGPPPELTEPAAAVHVPVDAALWPAGVPVRAGVSTTGGVHAHLALEEAPGRERRTGMGSWTTALVAGRQDADLLMVDADSAADLRSRLTRLAGLVATLSYAELTDVAGTLAIQQRGGAFRAAVVAADPADTADKLSRLADELAAGRDTLLSPADGVFLAHRTEAPRIAYLFPGQGAGRARGGALRRRFSVAEYLFGMAAAPSGDDHLTLEAAQALVVAGSVAGLRALHTLGIDADIAVGHGLGELTALSWGGAMDGGDLLRLAAVRAKVMTPAGPAGDVAAVCADARSRGLTATRLDVSHAFHSALVRPAADAMAERLARFVFNRLRRPVVSTVTGGRLTADTDLHALLADQLVEPVRFHEAAAEAVASADLTIEVGPGRTLSGLVAEAAPDALVLAMDTDSASLAPLLTAVGAAYALGADIDPTALFAARVIRPITEDAEPRPVAWPAEVTPATVTAGTDSLDHLPLSPATLGDPAERIDLAEPPGRDVATGMSEIPGHAPWVRPFSVVHVPAARPLPTAGTGTPGAWSLHAPAGHPFAERLRAAMVAAAVGDGVLLCLPTSGAAHVDLFLRAGREAAGAGPNTRFVVVQQDFGASGLARTLHLEHPSIRTTVIGLADAAPTDPAAADTAVARVVGDVAATTGFTEVRYTGDGTRTAPVLRALTPAGPRAGGAPLSQDDVLLVTGGTRCVTAECGLALAQDSGARLALLGRADPATDHRVSTTLARMAAAGVQVHYERADLTAAEDVRLAVERIEAALGRVTAVLHGAGRDEPNTLAYLTGEQLRRAIATKVNGLRTVLDTVGEESVRLLVTFGSIIGRAGLRGEAHHATANDWLTELTVDFGRRRPAARALALEWSVWSDMGEQFGVAEALTRAGGTPISLHDGLAALRRVLADPSAGPVLVVSGRTDGLPTITLDRPELPRTRFVERVLVHHPGVELVAEVELTAERDPYLSDHVLDGDPLFPAALGMEAMTQAAVALSGATAPPLLENVEFLRPIVVPPGGSTTVRLVAVAREAERVSVAIRSEETGFRTDHVRARLRFPRQEPTAATVLVPTGLPPVPMDPVAELYGGVLFQGKRFQRLLSFRKAAARHAVAELSTTTSAPWFATSLPQELSLADPGVRDAVTHAIQCCVPGVTLLPHRIERLYLADPAAPDPEVVVVDARERAQHGDSYLYDVDVLTAAGELVERWEGLTLRATRGRGGTGPWVPALLGPHLERATEAVLGGARTVVVEPDPVTGLPAPVDRPALTELAASRALGRRADVRYRSDGQPEIDGGAVSVSHGAGLTVVVTGTGRLGCAVEVVAEDTLLGGDQLALRDLVAAATGEPISVAATRVLSALGCRRAAGVPTPALTLDRVEPAGWVVLSDGGSRIATWVTTVNGVPDQVVFAVLSGMSTDMPAHYGTTGDEPWT